jgi:predicted RNase H-like HicB family nuclease
VHVFGVWTHGGGLNFKIEFERDEDGRWIAEISELPGVMAYGATHAEAGAAVEALALRVIADRNEAEKVGHKTISFATA